jgi:hypothetical protein
MMNRDGDNPWNLEEGLKETLEDVEATLRQWLDYARSDKNESEAQDARWWYADMQQFLEEAREPGQAAFALNAALRRSLSEIEVLASVLMDLAQKPEGWGVTPEPSDLRETAKAVESVRYWWDHCLGLYVLGADIEEEDEERKRERLDRWHRTVQGWMRRAGTGNLPAVSLNHALQCSFRAWEQTLEHWRICLRHSLFQQRYMETLEKQIASLQAAAPVHEVRAELPTYSITVRSQISQSLLHLMGAEGLGRSWRLSERVIEAEITRNENSVRNALRRLTERGAIADYEWKGRPVGWSPGPGGARRLVKLTDLGAAWVRTAFDIEPCECEMDVAVQRHPALRHAVGILEARDYLREQGFTVIEEPRPFLEDQAQPWGRRAEPDLLALDGAEIWPVEVQRAVHERYLKKWNKLLTYCGCLVLILFNEEHRKKQIAILKQARERNALRSGPIWISDLVTLGHYKPEIIVL